MFSVELYKEVRLLEKTIAQSERDAMTAIDAMITAVHKGAHGTGDFRVAADKVNELGLFQENIFDSETFPYPMKSRAA